MTTQELIAKQSEYIERIQQGERNLITDLWELLRPLTFHYIQRYCYFAKGERLYDESDLWQESFIALLSALDYYDTAKGGSFAVVYMQMIQNQTRKLRGLTGRDAIFAAGSLDVPLDNEGESATTRLDLIEDRAALDAYENADKLAYCSAVHEVLEEIECEQLTDQQRRVITARYYCGLSANQTAKALGASWDEVISEERKALKVYRHPRNAARLRSFVYLDDTSGSGLQAFRNNQASIVERQFERLEGCTPKPE